MTTTDHAIVAPAVTGDPGTRVDAGGFDPGRAYATRDGRKVLGLRPMPISGFIGKVGGEEYQWWASGRYVSGKTHPLDLVNVGVRPAAPDPIPQPEGDAPPAPAQSAGAAADGHAQPEALHAFAAFVWRQCMQGLDIDGGAAQDEAERLGLLTSFSYDPEKHGESDAEPGEEIFCLKPLAGSGGAAADGEGDAADLLVRAVDSLVVQKLANIFSPKVVVLGTSYSEAVAEAIAPGLARALARRGARPHEPADASARSAARAWLHAYGIKTERYTSGGGDHPAMDTLPAAFEAFASARSARGEVAEAVLAEREGGFVALRSANVARNVEWSAGNDLSLSFRGNELAGEVGEACNVLKKLDQERMGLVGSRATVADAAEELADVVICADLAAMDLGIDLYAAVVAKFNATSEKRALSTRMPTPADVLDRARPAGQGEREPVAWFDEKQGAVSPSVVQAARDREGAHQPLWLWHDQETQLVAYGRWPKGFKDRPAPYIRADVALYAAPPSAAAAPPAPASRATSAPAQDAGPAGVTEALQWYAEQVAGCRKLGSIGDPFRHALDADGGKRAVAALEGARARTPDAGKPALQDRIGVQRIQEQCAHYGGALGEARCLLTERDWAPGVVPRRCALCPDAGKETGR